MSNIRRQSIISSGVIYFGFAIGLLNTYFFTKEGLFTEAQYGLTQMFIAIATMMMAIANLAMPSYIYKFHPYYKDHLPTRKNDMITWSLLVSTIGFVLVMIAGILLKHLVIRKYSTNAVLLTQYYYWIFPMGFGLTVYTILEAYALALRRSVLANFLREVEWRLITTVLIILLMLGIIKDFDLFIKIFAFTYPGIAITLLAYLLFTKKIFITFKVSKVTRRFLKKIFALCTFVYSGTLIFTISQVFDSFVIASVLPQGLEKAGIFALAAIVTSVIQAPQRAVISASISHLSQAWKDKKIEILQKVYQRSSINLLIFAAGIFLLIWMNFTDAVKTFHLKPAYLDSANVFFILGLVKIVDMGTGVNAQIIGTSNYWRFELICGIILLTLMLPLTYIFAKQFGLIGPAYASLISISIYNIVRIIFLWKKFKLFPFTMKTVYSLLLAATSYAICYFALKDLHGLTGMILRSIVFIILYTAGIFYLDLSPDVKPVWETIKKRIRW